VDIEMRDRLHVALFEMIMNGIEHGNCGITYEEKTEYLSQYGDMIPLIREKCRDPEIGRRRVKVTYRITPDHSLFQISDDGDGFDWRARLNDDEVNFGEHGHGIRMTRHYIENLTYNEAGNLVSFEVHHEKQANATPGIFANQEVVALSDGEIVFREGEESNDLFYIITGRLDILSGDQRIAELSPDDIFLGEMSFLLGNRRSATVVARGRGASRQGDEERLRHRDSTAASLRDLSGSPPGTAPFPSQSAGRRPERVSFAPSRLSEARAQSRGLSGVSGGTGAARSRAGSMRSAQDERGVSPRPAVARPANAPGTMPPAGPARCSSAARRTRSPAQIRRSSRPWPDCHRSPS
jgi:hypothetical protein